MLTPLDPSMGYQQPANMDFWHLFRKGYSSIALVFSVALFVLAGVYYNTIEAYLLFGACLSAFFSLLVMNSYRNVPQWRRHPSPIIIQRTGMNFLFSLIIIANAINQGSGWNDIDDDGFSNSRQCQIISTLIQFVAFSGECWMFMISLDLVISLSNPFISYTSYLRRYHAAVWAMAIVNIVVYVNYSDCQGIFIEGICWVPYSDHITSCFFFFYLLWSVLFYVVSLGVVVYALFRLSVGLEATFDTRKRSVKSTFGVVIIYVVYGLILCVIYATLSFAVGADEDARLHNGDHKRSARTAEAVLAYLVGCRGFVDSIVWCLIIDYCQPEQTRRQRHRAFAPNSRYSMSRDAPSSVSYKSVLFFHYYMYYAAVFYRWLCSGCGLWGSVEDYDAVSDRDYEEDDDRDGRAGGDSAAIATHQRQNQHQQYVPFGGSTSVSSCNVPLLQHEQSLPEHNTATGAVHVPFKPPASRGSRGVEFDSEAGDEEAGDENGDGGNQGRGTTTGLSRRFRSCAGDGDEVGRATDMYRSTTASSLTNASSAGAGSGAGGSNIHSQYRYTTFSDNPYVNSRGGNGSSTYGNRKGRYSSSGGADDSDYDEYEQNVVTEIDLAPQLNMALRREVLHCATAGISISIRRKTRPLGSPLVLTNADIAEIGEVYANYYGQNEGKMDDSADDEGFEDEFYFYPSRKMKLGAVDDSMGNNSDNPAGRASSNSDAFNNSDNEYVMRESRIQFVGDRSSRSHRHSSGSFFGAVGLGGGNGAPGAGMGSGTGAGARDEDFVIRRQSESAAGGCAESEYSGSSSIGASMSERTAASDHFPYSSSSVSMAHPNVPHHSRQQGQQSQSHVSQSASASASVSHAAKGTRRSEIAEALLQGSRPVQAAQDASATATATAAGGGGESVDSDIESRGAAPHTPLQSPSSTGAGQSSSRQKQHQHSANRSRSKSSRYRSSSAAKAAAAAAVASSASRGRLGSVGGVMSASAGGGGAGAGAGTGGGSAKTSSAVGMLRSLLNFNSGAGGRRKVNPIGSYIYYNCDIGLPPPAHVVAAATAGTEVRSSEATTGTGTGTGTGATPAVGTTPIQSPVPPLAGAGGVSSSSTAASQGSSYNYMSAALAASASASASAGSAATGAGISGSGATMSLHESVLYSLRSAYYAPPGGGSGRVSFGGGRPSMSMNMPPNVPPLSNKMQQGGSSESSTSSYAPPTTPHSNSIRRAGSGDSAETGDDESESRHGSGSHSMYSDEGMSAISYSQLSQSVSVSSKANKGRTTSGKKGGSHVKTTPSAFHSTHFSSKGKVISSSVHRIPKFLFEGFPQGARGGTTEGAVEGEGEERTESVASKLAEAFLSPLHGGSKSGAGAAGPETSRSAPTTPAGRRSQAHRHSSGGAGGHSASSRKGVRSGSRSRPRTRTASGSSHLYANNGNPANLPSHERSLYALLTAYLMEEECVTFNVDKHKFVDHRPSTFQILRNLCGISNDIYLQYISTPAREKLTEGSSGAFMFNCGPNDELLVKTVSTEEKDTLLRILHTYTQHLHASPGSLLVRFLGLHTLNMYGHNFHFVVMKNVFPPKVSSLINERYDIKGSWVDRNATVFPPGQYTTCRYCNEYYISGSRERCPEKVGTHEPNVVFKDNNLTNKFRLNGEDAFNVIETLHSDSDALCAMGIMDYSMLVGIRNVEYEVDVATIAGSEGGGGAGAGGGPLHTAVAGGAGDEGTGQSWHQQPGPQYPENNVTAPLPGGEAAAVNSIITDANTLRNRNIVQGGSEAVCGGGRGTIADNLNIEDSMRYSYDTRSSCMTGSTANSSQVQQLQQPLPNGNNATISSSMTVGTNAPLSSSMSGSFSQSSSPRPSFSYSSNAGSLGGGFGPGAATGNRAKARSISLLVGDTAATAGGGGVGSARSSFSGSLPNAGGLSAAASASAAAACATGGDIAGTGDSSATGAVPSLKSQASMLSSSIAAAAQVSTARGDGGYNGEGHNFNNTSTINNETGPSGLLPGNNHSSSSSSSISVNSSACVGGYVARTVVAPGIYYFGIIDILQSWTLQKRLERLFKIHVRKHPAAGISCVPPEEYRMRFQRRVSEVIEHGIYVREVTGSWKGTRGVSEPAPLVASTAAGAGASSGSVVSGGGSVGASTGGGSESSITAQRQMRTPPVGGGGESV